MLPGTGAEYAKVFQEPIQLPVTAWIYSQANGRKIEISEDGVFGSKIIVLREARND